MKYEEKEVTSKEKVVGIAKYEQFDNVAEAMNHLGEAKVLSLINTQHGTNVKNAIRESANEKVSKTLLRKKAMAAITVEEFSACQGDTDKLELLLQKKVAELVELMELEKATA